MIITVASGKGGTGKTTIAVNLALAVAKSGRPVTLIDCDVEAPNAALFLRPSIQETHNVVRLVPQVDLETCTHCGRCAKVCRYHAIAVVGEQVLVFQELCHGCGSCTRNCPAGAIVEVPHVMGTVERGWAGPIRYAQGLLNIGEAQATPVIRQLKHWMVPGKPDEPNGTLTILDAPPGTSCPVVETLRGADRVLLVTEPTPFGLHDLQLAVELARDELHLPIAVVLNRAGSGDRHVEAYCAAEGLPIVMRIPFDRRIAAIYAEGLPLLQVLSSYRPLFRQLYRELEALPGARQTVADQDCAEASA